MAHTVSCAVRISTLTLCLAALYPATAFPQAASDVSSAATAAAAQAANVYVGTTKGVYLYNAASNGSLSLVSGSPFSITGSAVGSNGKYFFSLGTAYPPLLPRCIERRNQGPGLADQHATVFRQRVRNGEGRCP